MKILKFLIVIAMLMSVGCFGKGKPSNYYLMSAKDPLIRQAIEPTETFGVGPITLPEYLNREAFVTRKGDFELEISDLHRWGEPMRENLLRVLKSYLEVKAPAYRIETHPWGIGERPEKRMALVVTQFEQVAGKEVLLRVNGKLSSGVTSQYDVQVACASEDKTAIAQCMSEALEKLAEEIALSIRAG